MEKREQEIKLKKEETLNVESQAEDQSLDFFSQLKLRCEQRRENGDDSSSCFSATSSDSDSNPFAQHQIFESPLPVYRKEYGGIVIYDVDAIMEDDDFKPEKGLVTQEKSSEKISLTSSTRNKGSSEGSLSILQTATINNDSKEGVRYGPNECPPDMKRLKKQPMIKHLIGKEDRKILQNCIVEFPKKRSYRNEGRRNYKLVLSQKEELMLKFESRFENGNLWKAIKLSESEYNLVLMNDFNTNGHTQWYYFKVTSKLEAGTKIKFNIVNLSKPDSLYNEGMKPCVKSQGHYEKTGQGWHRDGTDISYKMNNFLRNRERRPDPISYPNIPTWTYYYFTFSFTYEFKYDDDIVWFAHAVPYTYSGDLLPLLNKLAYNLPLKTPTDFEKKYSFSNRIYSRNQSKSEENKTDYTKFLRIGTLCKTLAGNYLKFMIITDEIETYRDCNDDVEWILKNQSIRAQVKAKVDKDPKMFGKKGSPGRWEYENRLKKALFNLSPSRKNSKRLLKFEKMLKKIATSHSHKKGIFISARVHPGEPQSSWICQGLITFLVSNDLVAQKLRKNYIFKIIPMLNPDGVIYGNYRCSLLGYDLNRRWDDPSKYFDPTIYYTKLLLKVFLEEREVKLFCDLHGHSRKKNMFTYGCDYYNTFQESKYNNFHLRIFPSLLSSLNNNFSFKDCTFKIEQCKTKCARVVVFRQFGVRLSFTLECSFYGREKSKTDSETQDLHFKLSDFNKMGADICRAISHYLDPQFSDSIDTISKKYVTKSNEDSQYKSGLTPNQKEPITPSPKHSKILEKVCKTLNSRNGKFSKTDARSSSEESDSESDDNEANIVSNKIKQLKTKNKRDRIPKKASKETLRLRNKSKILFERRKIKDSRSSSSKTPVKRTLKSRKLRKNRKFFSHLKNVPAKEWNPEGAYNHIVPTEGSRIGNSKSSFPYEYKNYLSCEKNSEKKQSKIIESSSAHPNFEPKKQYIKRDIQSSLSKSTKKRRKFRRKNAKIHSRFDSQKEETSTDVNSTTPFLVTEKKTQSTTGKKKSEAYFFPFKMRGSANYIRDRKQEIYLGKRMHMNSIEKISLKTRENNRPNHYSESSNSSNLPKMRKLRSRKNTRTNARNTAQISPKPLNPHCRSIPSACPMGAQMLSIPFRTPDSSHLPNSKLISQKSMISSSKILQ
ncbi:unnamed protein product [Moneuplotes crassus]|uniref:Peptidase M14 domain-containing protein n=1 Tax=Euplotes crassus TaxID=5936 RepID=A0AAD1UGP8_EUPCR|nr:unnamed protein product [Moneuplotes crassus]